VNWGGATRAQFPDGRWHFQHGPIDLIIDAEGDAQAVRSAVERAWRRFEGLLAELVQELALLRSPVQRAHEVNGMVARRMVQACSAHRAEFITPMAAVAGAVADELIEAFQGEGAIRKAYVNNGGDIALHLAAGTRFRLGIAGVEDALLHGQADIRAEDGVRGVATSGWRGRSLSLGIADSVTVLSRSAACADASATMIGNHTRVDVPAVERRPAHEVVAGSDLGRRLVTVAVGRLSENEIATALEAGARHAQRLVDCGLIHGAALRLQGRAASVGACRQAVPAHARGSETQHSADQRWDGPG
jgi:uncharacterized protein